MTRNTLVMYKSPICRNYLHWVKDTMLGQIRSTSHRPPEELTPNSGDDYEVADERPLMQRMFWFLAPKTWRPAESLIQLRNQINELAPHRSKTKDGTIGDADHASRKSDHNPWILDSGVGVVTALDITHNPAAGCSAESIAESLRSSKDPRIKYVIWNRRIFSASIEPWSWRTYGGESAHTGHIHVSVVSDKVMYDSVANWRILLS